MKKIRTSLMMNSLIGFLLTILTLAAFYFSWTPLEELEYSLYDLGSSLREKTTVSPLVIVGIDDDSIAGIGRWPWPRGHIAQMIQFLSQAEAKVVGVDIIFSEHDLNQGLSEVREFIKSIEADALLSRNQKLTDLLKESERRLDNDAKLINAVAESKKVGATRC